MNERQTHSFDVCVVGGGMAGMCAAIAAARNGAKTALVQDRPVLGGNASSEIRMHICGARGQHNKETGILEETRLENAHRNPTGHYSIWDSVLYEKVRFQPNLTPFLNCTCTNCETEDSGGDILIRKIDCWQLTSQIWHTIEAKVFIDCSGDSVLAVESGAKFRTGRESRDEFDEDIAPAVADDKTMGNSILLQIRRTEQPSTFIPPRWAYQFKTPADLPNRMSGVAGHNFWWIELGGLQNTIHDAEEIRDELLKVSWGVWDYIKNHAPDREKADCWELAWLGSLPGKRENRRYVGEHILTQHDVRAGGDFADNVAYGGWPMDDHHPAGILYPGKPTLFHAAPSPFGIPYRSLYSRNVKNLLFAGRNISVTHCALSSTRVMATCAIIGQAVGTAAAISIRRGVSAGGIYPNHISELQQTLMDDDCYLPGLQRDVGRLAREAQVDAKPGLVNGYDRPVDDEQNAHVGPLGQPVTFSWAEAVNIAGARLVFDSGWGDFKMPHEFPHQIQMPKTLVKAFRLEALGNNGSWQTVYRDDHNYQRFVSVPLRIQATALRLIPEATWGGDEARLYGFEPLERAYEKLPQVAEGLHWPQVVQAVPAKDLAPPDSGLEK